MTRWWVAAARRKQIPWRVVVVVRVWMVLLCGLGLVWVESVTVYWHKGVVGGLITEKKQSMYCDKPQLCGGRYM